MNVPCAIKGLQCNAIHFAGILFACRTNDIRGVFYHNLTFEAKIALAAEVKDLDSIKFFCNSTGVDYQKYIYNSSCTPYSAKLASQLYDTVGFKSICPALWADRKNRGEYNNTILLKSNLELAILGNDNDWIRFIIANVPNVTALTNIFEQFPTLIELAYLKQHLDVATTLREAGSKINPEYLVHTNILVPQPSYIAHLVRVNATDGEKFIVSLLYSAPILNITSPLSNSTLLLKSSYTLEKQAIEGMYNKIYVAATKIKPLRDLLTLSSLITILHPTKFFFLNRTNHFDHGFYRSPIKEIHPYCDPVIYLSSQGDNLMSIFIHELGHYAFDHLYENKHLPYSALDPLINYDSFNKYQQAVMALFHNALRAVNVTIPAISFEQALLSVRHVPAFLALELHMHYVNRSFSVWSTNATIKKENAFFNEIGVRFANHSQRVNFTAQYVARYNLSESDKWSLHRLHDVTLYDAEKFHIEILNRLPELLFATYAMNDTVNATLLEPANTFWRWSISPRITKYIDDNFVQVRSHAVQGFTQSQVDDLFLFAYINDRRSDVKFLSNYTTEATKQLVVNHLIAGYLANYNSTTANNFTEVCVATDSSVIYASSISDNHPLNLTHSFEITKFLAILADISGKDSIIFDTSSTTTLCGNITHS